jgi:methyl-accepting chemotaxis protein
MARRNTDSLQQAARIVAESQQGFADANRLLDQTLKAISTISPENGQISKIGSVIDEIAFQTNILL